MTERSAGSFAAWADRTRDAQVGDADAAVPCDGCTACCRSSFFVHIGPDETATLDRIPRELLFRAPGLPPGYMVLGYDERGHCPMLVDDRCSIYENRPLTCRKFDCRVLSAAELDPDGPGQEVLTEPVRRWRFDVDSPRDRVVRDAVRAAVAYIEAHPECFEPGRNPVNAVQRSVTALAIYDAFVGDDGQLVDPAPDVVRDALTRLPQ
jgi:Fe-S-cluster containining protein